ncbi:MAG: hypothetical protein B7Z72_07365, partial [Gemmatimonadetes bacterium 21-71-4]
HGADRDALAGLRVADAYDRSAAVLAEGAVMLDFLRTLGRGNQMVFPVVDDDRLLIGVVALADLGDVAAGAGSLGQLIVAADVARPTETVTPHDSLLDAVRKMGVRGADAVPVVDGPAGGYLGLITRSQVLSLYERAVTRSRMDAD